MNRVTLCGNLAKNPEIKVTQTNKQVLDFSVAINDNKEKAEFIDCQAWEKTAEVIAKYFTKGSKILIEGRLATYTYEGQDGKKNKKTYVVVERIEFVEHKKKENEKPTIVTNEIKPDDLPFY